MAILAHRRKRINREQARLGQKKLGRRVKKTSGFMKPEKFVAEFRKGERDDTRLRRELDRHSLRPKAFVADGTKKLVLVFRHRGNRIASQAVIKILREMRLVRKYNAVFMQITPENQKLLAAVEPYVSWGYPSVSVVRDLIFKYGFTKENGKKVSISSNIQVEKALGKYNIICMEDLVHEVCTVGKYFDAASKYLCQFVLQAPKTGWEKAKGLHFIKGGECGFRADAINDLLQTIL